MVKYQEPALDRTFAALSDATRRALLVRLADNAFKAAERGSKLTTQLLAFSRTQKLATTSLTCGKIRVGTPVIATTAYQTRPSATKGRKNQSPSSARAMARRRIFRILA